MSSFVVCNDVGESLLPCRYVGTHRPMGAAVTKLINLDVLVDFLREHGNALRERSALHVAAALGKLEVRPKEVLAYVLKCS